MKNLTFSKVLALTGLKVNRKSSRDWMVRGAVVMTTLSMVFTLFTPVTFATDNHNNHNNNEKVSLL